MDAKSIRQIYGQRYYDAQLLKVADFERERDFHLEQSELQTSSTLSPGILIGLEVKARKGGRVHVGPGLALDDQGRQILLKDHAKSDRGSLVIAPGGIVLDLSGEDFWGKQHLLGIRWGRAADPDDPARTFAEPLLTVVQAADGVEPAPGVIELARVKIVATPQPAPPPGPAGSPPPETPPPIVQATIDRSSRVAVTLLPERIPPLDAAQIPRLEAGHLTGTLEPAQIPDLPAGKIATGTLDAARLPPIDAATIATGTLDAERLPPIDAASIATGTLDADRLPEIGWDHLIAGTLDVARIPDLAAGKISSGVLSVDRLPPLPASLISGRLTPEQVPDRATAVENLLFHVDKANVVGEETVTLTWMSQQSASVVLSYCAESKIVTKSWQAIPGERTTHAVTPHASTVFTLTASRQGAIEAQAQLTVTVIPASPPGEERPDDPRPTDPKPTGTQPVAVESRKTLKLDTAANYLAVNEATNTIFAANRNHSGLTVIDGKDTSDVRQIEMAGKGLQVTVDPRAGKVYCSRTEPDSLTVLDENDHQEAIPIDPSRVALSSTTNKIYVSTWSPGRVTVVDAQDHRVIKTIKVGGLASGLAVSSTTNKVYVTSCADGTVTVIDGNQDSVIKTIAVGQYPNELAMNQRTNKIYVANQRDTTITVIDGKKDAVLKTIDLGKQPSGLALSPTTNRIYVAHPSDDLLTVIDGTTDTVETVVAVGKRPTGVAVNSRTHEIFVACAADSSVLVLHHPPA